MSRSVAAILSAVIFLAGCATNSTPPDETISSPAPQTGGEVPSLNWTNPAAPKMLAVRPTRPMTPVAPTNRPPPAVARPAPTPTTTWVPLDRWATQRNIGKPHLLSDLPVAAYAVGSGSGVVVLEIGSRDATWNGVDFQLGFAPQVVDGEILVHGLDLQKNLEPLLSEPPLTFDRGRMVVIDPGHGGKETGTKSVIDGRFEKEFTLDWASRLAPLLEKEGWQVFLTRTADTDVPLADRVAFAETHHADLFISLHFNSGAPDERPAGLETYCLTPTGMPSTLTRGWPDLWSQIFPNNAFDVESLRVAIRLHTAILRATGMEDRGVCRARFLGVLRGQRRPAVLIEGGYLSNPREARRIEDSAFRQKLAEAVAAALKPQSGTGVPEPGANKLSAP